MKGSAIFSSLNSLLRDVCRVYFTLIKVMVPALIIVKFLDEIGGTEWLGHVLAPLMQYVGLPGEMALVWAAAMVTNLYTGMVVFFDVSSGSNLTVAQVTVIGSMILVAHALPVESAVSKMAGVRWRVTLPLRIIGSFILGIITHLTYQWGDWKQKPAEMIWKPETSDTSLSAWALDQVGVLITVFFVIAALMIMLRAFRLLGVEKLMHWLLSPVLKLLTIGKEATNITIIGITLGLSFGAGLLVEEARSGAISRRDIFLSVCFLCLCHSLIEDTLLILLLGADLAGILWGRLVFSLVVIAILARLIKPSDMNPQLSANG